MAPNPLSLISPHIGALALALIMDGLLGDPVYPLHPVRLIGKLIERFEGDLYPKSAQPHYYLLTGGLLVMGVLGIVGTVYALLASLIQWLYGGSALFAIIGLLLEGILIYQLLATRCLWDEGHRILQVMLKGDMDLAREQIGYLVSRDTKSLSASAVYKAAVETLTENITDAIVAPILAYSLLGLPGIAIYKAINTMDSMIGYKNDKYLYFGRYAARIDDGANFIPARVAAALIFIISGLRGLNMKASLRCFFLHRRFHSSPNAGCTEAAVAGALDIQLSGPTTYFGRLVDRPFIGFVSGDIQAKHLKQAMTIVAMAGLLAGGLGIGTAWMMKVVFYGSV